MSGLPGGRVRRGARLPVAVAALFLALGARAEAAPSEALLDQVRALVHQQVEARSLGSIIVQVRVGGQAVLKIAEGEAMAGVPVTEDGHFRNGAVAIAYVAAVLLKLNEAGIVDLDQPIAKWLPDLPGADTATPRMLASMTAGYPDYVANEDFVKSFVRDPFQNWSVEQRIAISLSMKRPFPPGANWDYSHSGYVILGRVLEKATGKPMRQLMDEYLLAPLKLGGTQSEQTAAIPAPVIHAFTAERGVYEDSTYWNPSWSITEGAVQTTTVDDMARSFEAIVGTDGFLSASSRRAMIDPKLVGFGAPLAGCRSCHTLTREFAYGLGVFLENDWVMQTPLFGGYAAAVATLPAERAGGEAVTIAVSVTSTEASYPDWNATLPNYAEETVKRIGILLVPDNPPPPFKKPTL